MKTVILSFLLSSCFLSTFGKITLHEKKTTQWPFYQSENRGFNPERLVYGANLGMDFIRDIDTLNDESKKGWQAFFNGFIGYRFGRRTMIGIGLGYNFRRTTYEYKNTENSAVYEKFVFKSPNTSLSLFLRYFFMRKVFLHIEPEMNYYSDWQKSFEKNGPNNTGRYLFTRERIEVPACLTGIGIVLPINENVSFILQGLYDVVQDKNSPYNKLPIIRGGLSIGMF